jgi:hypothetical protein
VAASSSGASGGFCPAVAFRPALLQVSNHVEPRGTVRVQAVHKDTFLVFVTFWALVAFPALLNCDVIVHTAPQAAITLILSADVLTGVSDCHRATPGRWGHADFAAKQSGEMRLVAKSAREC